MKNTQKAFATPLLITLISVIAVVTIGVVVFIYNLGNSAQPQRDLQIDSSNQTKPVDLNGDSDQSNDLDVDGFDEEIGAEADVDERELDDPIDEPIGDPVNVIAPLADDRLVIGEEVIVEWDGYEGDQNLIISLQIIRASGQIRNRNIASDVPNTGEYIWTVPEESPDSTYRIEIYPVGARELVGRSGVFYISMNGAGNDSNGSGDGTEDDRIKSVLPSKNSRIDASKPIEITGLAKGVYHEAEFSVEVSHIVDGQKEIITQTYASCSFEGDGCEWMGDDFVEFRAVLDLSSSPSCEVNVALARSMIKDDDTPDVFYNLPLTLYGITGCGE